MRGRPTTWWGKLQRDADQQPAAWHPLADHCVDVGCCAIAILERSLLRDRLARLAGLGALSDVDIARLGVIAGLHDVGKLNVSFQRRAFDPTARGGHATEGADLVTSIFEGDRRFEDFIDALDLESMVDWFSIDGEGPGAGLQLLWLAAVGHHGGPVAARPSRPGREWFDLTHAGPPLDGARALAAALRAAFPVAWEEQRPLPVPAAFQHSFAGLVMLADWVGSDPSPDAFRYSDPSDPERGALAGPTARAVLGAVGLDGGRNRAGLSAGAPLPILLDGRAPRPAQALVGGLDAPEADEPTVVVLEAETGSGKTEAALAHFARLLARGAVDGLYFALPTRAAATQIHRRVCKAVRALWDSDPPAVVLAVPGYLRVDDQDGRRLAPFEAQWPDSREDAERHRTWAAEHPKRYLAGPIVVGTVDQVLLSALRARHAHMRATALTRSLLVVDEVHASDVYMNALLRRVLERHGAAGGHALLLSATLGTAVAARLLDEEPPTTGAGLARPYPLVSVRRGARPVTRLTVEAPGEDKEVRVEPFVAGDETAFAARAADFAANGARVLVLRNLVGDAVATQRAVEGLGVDTLRVGGVPAPHHGRFAAEDRRLLDEAVEHALAPRRRAGGIVVVATQTVEQSLDIDADVLITDLAPIDVLLQRIGRLHRHPDDGRPAGFEAPRCLVHVPDGAIVDLIGAKGGGHGPHGWHELVYADLRILQRTRDLVGDGATWVIPSMNRQLVESATHPVVLRALAAEGDPRWERHSTRIIGLESAQRGIAHTSSFDWSKDYADAASAAERDTVVATRLGLDDRQVDLPDGCVGPFGRAIRRLRIPGALARGAPDDAVVRDITQHPDGFSFRWGDNRYGYTRFGLTGVQDG